MPASLAKPGRASKASWGWTMNRDVLRKMGLDAAGSLGFKTASTRKYARLSQARKGVGENESKNAREYAGKDLRHRAGYRGRGDGVAAFVCQGEAVGRGAFHWHRSFFPRRAGVLRLGKEGL